MLDTEFLLPQQQSVNALESPGLAELAGREVRAELSALEARPVWWAARMPPYGHDTLTYARPQPAPSPGGAGPDRRLVELIPSQMTALRVFVHLAGQLRVAPTEQVRAALCDHGIKRWRPYLTGPRMPSGGGAGPMGLLGRGGGRVESPAWPWIARTKLSTQPMSRAHFAEPSADGLGGLIKPVRRPAAQSKMPG